MKEEQLKKRMSHEEMYALFSEVNVADPNPNNVGRFAKKMGYVHVKQAHNNKVYYYYVKKDAL